MLVKWDFLPKCNRSVLKNFLCLMYGLGWAKVRRGQLVRRFLDFIEVRDDGDLDQGTGSGDGWNRIPDIFLNSSDRTW